MSFVVALNEHGRELVDACRAYCAMTGLTPVRTTSDEGFLVSACNEYVGEGIGDLNDTQRCLIAGVDYTDQS